MKNIKLILITAIVFLMQENSIGQTATLPRELGPLQLEMSLENVIEAAGIKNIQPCSREQEKILENFAKHDRDCHLLMLLGDQKVDGMISSVFNINGLDLTHLSGHAKVMNERIQALTVFNLNKIEFFFVNKRLSMILIEEPNVDFSYLNKKYGQYQFDDDKSQNLQCINNNGFNDISWFGVRRYYWESQNEKIDFIVQKNYSNSKRCTVESWNNKVTYVFRDKKLWGTWKGAFDSLEKNKLKKKSDF